MKSIILYVFILVALLFVAVFLFTEPAIWKRFDFSETGNIGDTIGGISAPILGVLSFFFLYQTLNKQIDSINDQKLKNESDFIFMLINQLENELNNIYFYKRRTNIREKFEGLEALNEYSQEVNKFYSTNSNVQFKNYDISSSIILVIRSFKLIEERIIQSKLKDSHKTIFLKKMNIFFICKLKKPLNNLKELFERVNNLNDEYTEEIIAFYNYQKNRYI